MAATATVKRPSYPGQFVWRAFKQPPKSPPLSESEIKARYRARLNEKSIAKENEAEQDMCHSAMERSPPQY